MRQGNREYASTAMSPDHDWTQVTETMRLLDRAVALISKAVHEDDDSSGSWIGPFAGMAGSVDTMAQAIGNRYSMREEPEIFLALLQVATSEEALAIVSQRVTRGDIGDAEPF